MKSKKFSKKLNLNKMTIAHLEMKKTTGGCLYTEPSACPTVTCPTTGRGLCCIPESEICETIFELTCKC
jgi:hypothetical protein